MHPDEATGMAAERIALAAQENSGWMAEHNSDRSLSGT
jgi:hypothetical protein